MLTDSYVISNSRLLGVKFWGSYTQIFGFVGCQQPKPHVVQGSTPHKDAYPWQVLRAHRYKHSSGHLLENEHV